MTPMKLKALAAAACLSLGAASTANALILTLDDLAVGAGAEMVATDAGTPGLINFNGSVGGFDLVLATGLGAPVIGSANIAGIDLSLQTAAGTIGTLEVTLEDTGLNIMTDASGQANAVSNMLINSFSDANVTIDTFIRVGGGSYEALSSLSGMSGSFDLVDGITGTLASNVLFDLRTVITVDHTSALSSANAGSSLILSPGEFSAVPLPAALPLLLASVAGLGFVGRRRKS